MKKQNWKPVNMIYPVPAVMVSCAQEGEAPNIITVAWCGTICTNPAMVSISIRPERYSYGIIEQTKEFVINLTTEKLCRMADFCGVKSGREVDKFQTLGLTPQESLTVKAPGIAESPVNIECRVTQILPLGSHHMFLAEVQGVSVAEELLDARGALHLERADLVAYSHGAYVRLGEELGRFGYSVRRKGKGKKKQGGLG